MKNREKYRDEIIYGESKVFCDVFVKPNVLEKYGLECSGTSCTRCATIQTLWLDEEAEEPETDWSKVPVDTLIEVKDFEQNDWVRRYFAEYKDGMVYAWENGRTSFTAYGGKTYWKYARLVEDK